MFYAAVVLIGVVSLSRLPAHLLPDLSCPKLTVWTTYPGAAAAELEASVTVPIEGALSTLSGLRRMGLGEPRRVSLVTLEFPCTRCRRSLDRHAAGGGSSWARWTSRRQVTWSMRPTCAAILAASQAVGYGTWVEQRHHHFGKKGP